MAGDLGNDLKVQPILTLNCKECDAIFLVSAPDQEIKHEAIAKALNFALKSDPGLDNEATPTILPVPELASGRLVYSPTGPLNYDYDDVRSLRDAAVRGVKRALKAGVKKPLIVLTSHPRFKQAELVTLLGVFEALYVPIQHRELDPSKKKPVDYVGVLTDDPKKTESLIRVAKILENGRRVARDIGEGDPERMAPPKVKEYLTKVFSNTSIQLKFIEDEGAFKNEYPLFEAVNRGASVVPRHRGNIAFLEYNPPDPKNVKETLFLVGKGVTYDTGGADIKAGGVMAGMSRDKCGAAAVAGFMKVVNDLKPTNIRVVGALGIVRNSVGSNCYLSDELIKARSGVTVRIGNTDAEGRMVMADLLCRVKEIAFDAINPHLFTVATLTGHAFLTVGPGYTIVMDNGPAKKANFSKRLQNGGEEIGDMIEISTIRREDIAFHRGKSEGDDIHQSNNAPSVRTARGHQGPAGFLLLASGLDKHGSNDEKPLKYSHLDIAGSAGTFPDPTTGAPVLALASTFLLN